MFPIHSRREIPRKSGIEGITDDNLPGSISSALLEMVTIGDLGIIVARATSSLRAVRNFAVDGQGTSVESLQNNLFVAKDLGRNRSRIEHKKKEDHGNGEKKYSRLLTHLLSHP
jgi:hypothetical protein